MKLPFGLTPVVLFFLWGCTSAPTGAPSDSPRSFEEQTDEYSKAMLPEGGRCSATTPSAARSSGAASSSSTRRSPGAATAASAPA